MSGDDAKMWKQLRLRFMRDLNKEQRIRIFTSLGALPKDLGGANVPFAVEKMCLDVLQRVGKSAELLVEIESAHRRGRLRPMEEVCDLPLEVEASEKPPRFIVELQGSYLYLDEDGQVEWSSRRKDAALVSLKEARVYLQGLEEEQRSGSARGVKQQGKRRMK